MGKVMSKEKDARDIALKEYDEFMDKYKDHVEAGDMKLMQHMLRLESNKIRSQEILDAVEKSSPITNKSVYDFDEYKQMKIQMSPDEYREDQKEKAFEKMATKPITIGDPDKMDTFKFNPADFGQLASDTELYPDINTNKPTKDLGKAVKEKSSSSIKIDPETGKKIYTGPKLRSRRIVKGKEWDENHPNFHDKNVGGM